MEDTLSLVSFILHRIKMSTKQMKIACILGAVSVILIYTVFHGIALPQQKNAIRGDKILGQKQKEIVQFDEEIDTVSSSSVHSDTSEFDVRRSMKKKLTNVKSRIKGVEDLLERRKEELEISEDMMKLALKHKTSVARLIQKFKEVLLTNRTFAIGVLGGSISVGVGVDGTKAIYATTLAHYLEKMLGTEVTVENGAIGAMNSYYYSYCFQTHCNVHNADLLFWEFACNDQGNPKGFLGQERLTRMILADLPNQPQLIYTNFLGGKHMDRYTACVDSERNVSLQLSHHYDVPSISMPDAICGLVRENKAGYLFGNGIHDGHHPGLKGHDMVAIFLTELIKEALMETIENLEKQLYESGYMKKYISEGKKPDNKIMDSGVSHGRILPPILFNTTDITHPQCWSLMGSDYRPSDMTLNPQDKFGWTKFIIAKKDYRSDLKQVWNTFRPGAFIEFGSASPLTETSRALSPLQRSHLSQKDADAQKYF
ncbi:uncharacterized protein [Ptychodera flava]|uniref:uncharacterized protein n=1 Tax=Ptychodera flava TaxID=63121 RepID=UPI00396A6555